VPRPVFRIAGRLFAWALACLAAWLGWAWSALGLASLAALALALGLHAWWRRRGVETPPGLPRPLDAATLAAWIAGLLVVAVAVGYAADWLVRGALVAVFALKTFEVLRGVRR